MKDEEKAEEYVQSIEGDDCVIITDREERKQAFLAGLKAGRPQWHDLRKDPNDLPKEDIYLVIRLNDENTCYKYCTGFWEKDEKVFHTLFCDKVDTKDIIAWCEIPQFKE